MEKSRKILGTIFIFRLVYKMKFFETTLYFFEKIEDIAYVFFFKSNLGKIMALR